MAKNTCGKTRNWNKGEKPYEVWKLGDWTWNVYKKYQSPEAEAKNPYARWFCGVSSPMTYGGSDYGDTYVSDIKGCGAKLVETNY